MKVGWQRQPRTETTSWRNRWVVVRMRIRIRLMRVWTQTSTWNTSCATVKKIWGPSWKSFAACIYSNVSSNVMSLQNPWKISGRPACSNDTSNHQKRKRKIFVRKMNIKWWQIHGSVKTRPNRSYSIVTHFTILCFEKGVNDIKKR